MRTEALTMAALCGVSAHAVMGAKEPSEIAKRAAAIAEAMAKELDARGPNGLDSDDGPVRNDTIESYLGDIRSSLGDLVERVDALETSLGVNDATPTHEGG